MGVYTWNQCQWGLGLKRTYFANFAKYVRLSPTTQTAPGSAVATCGATTSDGANADDDAVEVLQCCQCFISSTSCVSTCYINFVGPVLPFWWQIPVGLHVLANSALVTCTAKFRYLEIHSCQIPLLAKAKFNHCYLCC